MFIFLALVAIFNFSRGQHKIHFCEIILILDLWFRRYWYLKISYLELWSPFCGAEPFVQFYKEQCEEQFCEFILYLDKWFRRRCRLNQFLSRALAVSLFRGGEPFVQFW